MDRRSFLGRLFGAVALLIPGLPAVAPKVAEAAAALPSQSGSLDLGSYNREWQAHCAAWTPLVTLDRSGIHFKDFSITDRGRYIAHTAEGAATLRRAMIDHVPPPTGALFYADSVSGELTLRRGTTDVFSFQPPAEIADQSRGTLGPATNNVQSFALPEGMAVTGIYGHSAADGSAMGYDVETAEAWRWVEYSESHPDGSGSVGRYREIIKPTA